MLTSVVVVDVNQPFGAGPLIAGAEPSVAERMTFTGRGGRSPIVALLSPAAILIMEVSADRVRETKIGVAC
jgi:hypothetical protein